MTNGISNQPVTLLTPTTPTSIQQSIIQIADQQQHSQQKTLVPIILTLEDPNVLQKLRGNELMFQRLLSAVCGTGTLQHQQTTTEHLITESKERQANV